MRSILISLGNVTLGMVSVCGGCDAYYPWAALFLGAIAGALHLLASIILVKLKIDDPLDAAPIHFVCGKMGYAILTNLLSKNDAI